MKTLDNWSWLELNEWLKRATEAEVGHALKQEQKGKNRSQFVKRIHSRLNKMRADRERKELNK